MLERGTSVDVGFRASRVLLEWITWVRKKLGRFFSAGDEGSWG